MTFGRIKAIAGPTSPRRGEIGAWRRVRGRRKIDRPLPLTRFAAQIDLSQRERWTSTAGPDQPNLIPWSQARGGFGERLVLDGPGQIAAQIACPGPCQSGPERVAKASFAGLPGTTRKPFGLSSPEW